MSIILCLANSYKHHERCVAGIDIQSKCWIRPISRRPGNAINDSERKILGLDRELAVLDLVNIPLLDHGDNIDCQPENRWLDTGSWEFLAKIKLSYAKSFCEAIDILFFNTEDRIDPETIKALPMSERRSLILIQASNVFFLKQEGKWKVGFRYNHHFYTGLRLTDPVMIEKLNQGHEPSDNCLLTVSLTIPFSHSGPKFCWKLVAGVIELERSELSKIVFPV